MPGSAAGAANARQATGQPSGAIPAGTRQAPSASGSDRTRAGSAAPAAAAAGPGAEAGEARRPKVGQPDGGTVPGPASGRTGTAIPAVRPQAPAAAPAGARQAMAPSAPDLAGTRLTPSTGNGPSVWTRAGRAALTAACAGTAVGGAVAGRVATLAAVPADAAENGRTDRLDGAFRLAATRALKGGDGTGKRGLRAPSAPAGQPGGRAARVWRRAKTAAAAPVRATAVAASAEDGQGSPLRGVAPELASRALGRAMGNPGPRREAARRARAVAEGPRGRPAARSRSASPKGSGPDLTARRQDRVFQDRSRAVRAGRGAKAASGGARVAAREPAQSAAGAAGVLRALAAGAGASLAPLALAALAVAAVVLVVVGLVGAVLSAGFFGMQQGTYSSMARVALAEYESGVLDGTYHHDDPKYWAYATGSAYSDGASTPWCAAFVSWCANECGYVDSGLFPRTAGVGSIIAHFEADPNLGTVVDFADYDYPRPGDIVCYGSASGSGSACTDHVGVVVSVEGSSSDGYSYFYTVEGNTSSDGMGGDSACVGRHVFWNNNAGIADAPLWQLTYWDYAKVIQPNYPEAAYGDIEIPETYTADDGVTYRVGTFATREWDPGVYSFDAGTDAWRVEQAWKARGSVYDPRGFSTIDGKYMIACTSTFGTVGDEIVFYFDDGTELDCVMTDTKDQSTAHGTPATMWGHCDFASRQIGVLEFLGTPAIGDNPYVALGLQGARVVGATNLGRYV